MSRNYFGWAFRVHSAVVLSFLLTLAAKPASAQSYVWPTNGHTYVLLSNTDWQSSYSEAVAAGGYLVTVNDSAEQAWLQATIEVSEFWIGFNDVANEGTFVWASGQTPTYLNWNSTEPNNGPPPSADEDCGVLMRWASGKWNDWRCDQARYGLAEINTTPVPTATPTITPTPTNTPTSTPTPTLTPTPSPAAVIYRLGEDGDEIWHVGR